MSSDKDGLQFSNFDLSENHKNDTQEEETLKNYNPISEITKLESFGFEFESDEDIEEGDQDQIILNTNTQKVSHDIIDTELIIDEFDNDEDVLLMPEDAYSSTSDNIDKQRNTSIESYQKEFNNIKDDTLSEFDNSIENNLYKENNQIDFSDLANEVSFDSNFEGFDDINISTHREDSNNIFEDDRDILKDNISSRENTEDELKSITSSENNEYQNNDNEDISEEDAEDILAQVMSQDFTTPIEGFEKYAEIKRIRSEASKALEGSSYNEFDIEFDNEFEKDKFGTTSIINDEEEEILDSFKNEERNAVFVDESFDDDDEELKLFSDIDEEIGQTIENQFDNVDLSDMVDFDDIASESNIDEIFNDSGEDSLKNSLDNENTTIDDIDISNITNINIDDESDDELDLLFGEDKEDLKDDELESYNNEFDIDDLAITDDNEENIDDEYNFDDLDQEEDDSGIDDNGFNLDLGNNGDGDNQEEDNLDNEFNFDILDQEENNSEIDDGGFNIDLGSSDDDEDLDDEFNFDDLDQEEDGGGIDDGGFNIDFGSSEDSDDDDEFNFDNDSIDDEFLDSGEFDFDDVNFNDDLDVDKNNEFDFDNSDESEFGEGLDFSQESEEFTSTTNKYLEKLKKLKNSFPDLSKVFTAKTKEYLRKLKEIKAEMKEEGFKPTSKKYCNLATVQISKSVKDISNNIQKKLQTKQKSKIKERSKTENNDDSKKVNVKLEEWDGGSGDDTWGLGPVNQSSEEASNESSIEKTEEAEADWDDSEEFSFSTADMLMDDEELGLEEFSGFGEASKNSKETEEEEDVDYSGVLGKFRRIKRILYKWSKLIYKYFDSKIDFEKNWWKVIDFIAVVVLITAFAMVLAYYLWHK